MVTRMELVYRSKNPCSIQPAIFSTGSYKIAIGDMVLNFDFESTEYYKEIKDGYLYICSVMKNFDEYLIDDFTLEEVDVILKSAKKEDFTEIFYECFAEQDEEAPIILEPLSITFYDFSASGEGSPITVGGDAFSMLEI